MKNHSIFLTALLGILAFTPVSALQADENQQSLQAAEPAKPEA